MKKIQFVLMSSFILGACQLAVISGSADELNAKEATTELASGSVENGEAGNVLPSKCLRRLILVVKARKIHSLTQNRLK